MFEVWFLSHLTSLCMFTFSC